MLNSFFKGIFNYENMPTLQKDIDPSQFFLCIGVSLLIGIIIAITYIYKTKFTNSFLITLALLPVIVCVVILMVNGNIGAGVAVAGAFSLVRFRSIPGTAKEIGMIFLAMANGLICGMGYLGIAVLFSIIVCLVMFLYTILSDIVFNKKNHTKILKITIPEDLDYTNIFTDLLNKYTLKSELIKVKTINMGSMFRVTYEIVLKKIEFEKELIDKIRERNGNLEIMITKKEIFESEL